MVSVTISNFNGAFDAVDRWLLAIEDNSIEWENNNKIIIIIINNEFEYICKMGDVYYLT